MASRAEEQIAACAPPRLGKVWAVEVDSTSRAYNISKCALGGYTPESSLKRKNEVVLYLQAETNDVFFHFHSATSTDLDDAAKQTATSADLAFANTYGAILEAGAPPLKVRIDRSLDKFIIVTAASTAGILRMWAGSEGE